MRSTKIVSGIKKSNLLIKGLAVSLVAQYLTSCQPISPATNQTISPAPYQEISPEPYANVARPNILWITSEDNGQFIGCYGDPYAKTPNIDALAYSTAKDGTKEGVYFTNAFSNAPVCAPSRSAIITGMVANTTGTEQMRSDHRVPDFIQPFTKYMRDQGYSTFNNGKTDYNLAEEKKFISKGWDESSEKAHYNRRKDKSKPFFQIYNLSETHESSLVNIEDREVDKLLPYFPDTEVFRKTWGRYYDRIKLMDNKVGKIVDDLKKVGEWDDTIVFYYSDHAGAHTGMKRFCRDNGTRTPVVVRIPAKYHYLLPGDIKNSLGGSSDRLVSYIDLAPTLLSIIGADIPSYMQGKAFMGSKAAGENEYVFKIRARVDERYEMVRAVSSKKYEYIRHYNRFLPYFQPAEYNMNLPMTKSWLEEYAAGNLNSTQASIFGLKPYEELFDLENDRHETANLAQNPEYADILAQMRKVMDDWQNTYRDVGFIPEEDMSDSPYSKTTYEVVNSPDFPYAEVKETADKASRGNAEDIPYLKEKLSAKNDVVRYWAAVGCYIQKDLIKNDEQAINNLKSCLEGSDGLKVAASRTLMSVGAYVGEAEETFIKLLKSQNIYTRLHALNAMQEVAPVSDNILDAVKKLDNNKENLQVQKAAQYLINNNMPLLSAIKANNQEAGNQ